jgi:hypothetical protein
MLIAKTQKSPDEFWQEYEEKIGEKVLARSLGQYISGWEEFESRRLTALWGLIIATTGGFRFHHFPQQSWLDAFSRNTETPKDKTIFIPRDNIISAQITKENRWWIKILKSPSPQLIIRYRNETGEEKQLLLEADLFHGDFIESLTDKT